MSGLDLGLSLGSGPGRPGASSDRTGPVEGKLDYVELPVSDLSASKAFFETVFGWTLTAFGPDYAATEGKDTNLGLDGSDEAIAAPLAVIRTDDIDAAFACVEKAGGVVTRPVFAFPGGRRFHFREPSGNELAVWQVAEQDDAAS